MNKEIKKTPYFKKPKDYLVAVVALIGIVYMLNFGFGFVEFLPDNIPIVGNMDEAAALFLVYSSAEYFGINIKSLFTRDGSVKKQNT